MESNSNLDNKNIKIVDSDFAKSLMRLKDCQKDRNLNSCLNCDINLWNTCLIRLDYINRVYKNMSNNSDGDFEF